MKMTKLWRWGFFSLYFLELSLGSFLGFSGNVYAEVKVPQELPQELKDTFSGIAAQVKQERGDKQQKEKLQKEEKKTAEEAEEAVEAQAREEDMKRFAGLLNQELGKTKEKSQLSAAEREKTYSALRSALKKITGDGDVSGDAVSLNEKAAEKEIDRLKSQLTIGISQALYGKNWLSQVACDLEYATINQFLDVRDAVKMRGLSKGTCQINNPVQMQKALSRSWGDRKYTVCKSLKECKAYCTPQRTPYETLDIRLSPEAFKQLLFPTHENKEDTVSCLDFLQSIVVGPELFPIASHALNQFKAMKIFMTHDLHLPGDQMKIFLEALKNNTSLTSIYFLNSKIGVGSRKKIGELLNGNHTLKYITFQNSQIGDDGAKAIADFLENNHVLKELRLTFSEIGDAGAKDLADKLKNQANLTLIDFRGNDIRDPGVQEIVDAIKGSTTLTKMNLASNEFGDIGGEKIGDALKSNHTLKELELQVNRIGDVSAKALAEGLTSNHTLEILNLVGNKIGDIGMGHIIEALKSNTTLKKILLVSNPISAKTRAALQALKETRHDLEILY